MSRSVRVKIRPEKSLKFPGECAHCGQPATERMKISRRKRSIIRLIEVPICGDCFQEINRRSWAEERWLRIGLLVTGVIVVVVLAVTYFLLPTQLAAALRLLTASILSALVAFGLWGIFKQKSSEMARPEKKAILSAVQMVDFSWRVTTFSFSREDFSEKFAKLNQQQLMENELRGEAGI